MSTGFDQSTIIQVQQANDIIDIVGEHVSLSKKGREMVGLCPFHDDHKPSMYVNPFKQIFKCFACGAGGDVFKFIQMRENLTFPQAIERLAERAGIAIKVSRFSGSVKKVSSDIDPNLLAKANGWSAEYFQKNLADKEKGAYGREYLEQRKITDESINRWRLGLAFSGDDLLKTARAKQVTLDTLTKAGLLMGQSGDKFTNRLMFPITDVTGRVIGFGGRTLENAPAKYINSPSTALFDKSNCLYGLEHARHKIVSSGTAVVVEGYTDVIMAHQAGCENVVATLGTSLTAGHGRILRRYAKKAVLVFDSDVAGVEAANRALQVCLAQKIDIKIASVPQGKDPCDFVLEHGKEAFDDLVENAIDVFQFKWKRLTESLGNDNKTLSDNKTAIEDFLQTVATAIQAQNIAAIDQGLIVNKLSNVIGLSSQQIREELAKRVKRGTGQNIRNQKVQRVDFGEGLGAAVQREILEVLLNEPGLFANVSGDISVDDFDVPEFSQIASVLFESLNKNAKAALTEVLGKIEEVEIANIITELSRTGEQKGNYTIRLNDAIEALKRLRKQNTTTSIKDVEDQTKFLRNICENAAEENLTNLGML